MPSDYRSQPMRRGAILRALALLSSRAGKGLPALCSRPNHWSSRSNASSAIELSDSPVATDASLRRSSISIVRSNERRAGFFLSGLCGIPDHLLLGARQLLGCASGVRLLQRDLQEPTNLLADLHR